MPSPRALIIRTAGINCDLETEQALAIAGFTPERTHVNRLARDSDPFAPYHFIVFPGGFSYGDDVASGKVAAVEIAALFGEALPRFVERGGLVLGICNGFQTLVKMGILPGIPPGAGSETPIRFTLTHNDSRKFEARWVRLVAPANARSVFVKPGETLELPIAHGEGKLVASGPDGVEALSQAGLVGYRYAPRVKSAGMDGRPQYPDDPNGSLDQIAALSDVTGRVFGLMPHPERFMYGWHHPRWTREGDPEREGDGLLLFRRARKAVDR